MNDKKKSKSATLNTQRVSRPKTAKESGKKPAAKTRKVAAKTKTAVAKSRKAKTETVAAPAAKRAPKKRKAIGKTKEPVQKTRTRKAKSEAGSGIRIGEPVLNTTVDVSSGETMTYLGDDETVAQAVTAGLNKTSETEELTAAKGEANAGETVGGVVSEEGERETNGEMRPPAKLAPVNLERLQKILSQAGIASRRHAEEMIVAGRVMVNGQVVTQLGSKADPARDHIRVDGKLLQGAERHRYFVLNKPKGYVTTVSDPEGRQTVMEFFARMPERLYPVGRLDYQSEGLLLMTNDGELANLLTKAGSGVEKTYLVKVAGEPTEEEMERLRGGVTIEREGSGSGYVRTAPARVRQVREGDNPWYEVVLIEGRNRELRKMFSAVGHFVEKIRRVGYGPLVLDVEPGKLRELQPEEVAALRLTAEGKLKTKRMRVDRIPPAKAQRATDQRVERIGAREERPRWQRDERPKKTEWRPRKPEFRGRQRGEFRGGAQNGFDKPRGQQFGARQERFIARPVDSGARPGFDRPRSVRPFSDSKPAFDKPRIGRSFSNANSNFARPTGKPGRFGGASRPKAGAGRTFRGERPAFGARPRFERPQSGPNPRFERPAFPGRPQGEQTKPRFERPAFRGRPRNEEEKPGFPAKPRFDAAKRGPFRPQSKRPAFKRDVGPQERFEKPPAGNFGARPGKPWTERPRTGAPRAEGKKQFTSGDRFESRGGSKLGGFSKPGGFSKADNKGPGFRGKFGGNKRGGFRPPGKPGGGMKRG
jgi:23S rRNA pseudouridine2605 synthase